MAALFNRRKPGPGQSHPCSPRDKNTCYMAIRLYKILWLAFGILKRPSQKSLPSSFFQREESFLVDSMQDSTFSPLEKRDKEGF
jgi:hypothetical protein